MKLFVKLKMRIFKKFLAVLLVFASGVRCENYESLGRICQGADVRKIEDLRQLEDCQVIEGSVRLLTLNVPTNQDVSLPQLTEIVGHLLVYKVSGLKSISQIFPSLARINGAELFKGFSLIINENPDLENVGLTHLSSIANGAIRIEGNEMLCFVHTVNWTLIMIDAAEKENVINGNMHPKFCPKCDNQAKNCWTRNDQQLTCKCKGNSCNADGSCCDASCLSCRSDDAKLCSVCKQNIYGLAPHQQCVKSCPYHSFQFMKYRCITTQECKNLNINKATEPPFIPFQGVCQEGCPKDFSVKYDAEGNKMSGSCSPCRGRSCWKSCKGGKVIDVETATKFKDCQVVEGALEIQLKARLGLDKDSLKEIQNSLSSVVEIEDYLKITRSPIIVTLNFLKSLKVIRGLQLESLKYALVIWDNERLLDLFETGQEVRIDRGKISVEFNPKLCYNKIQGLTKNATIIENIGSAKLSNGDKVECNVTKIEVDIIAVSVDGASLQWQPFKLEDDDEKTLAYMVFYMEALEQKVEPWQQQDEEEWDVEDVNNATENPSYSIPNLKPYTQYAYFVRAYAFLTHHVAQSETKYFTTLPGVPEQVQRLGANSESSTQIIAQWEPPKNLNGVLEKYELRIRKLSVMKDRMNQRDFCRDPVDLLKFSLPSISMNSTASGDHNDDFSVELDKLAYERPSGDDEFVTEAVISETWDKVFETKPDRTEFTVENLDHFSSYVIDLRACREKNERDKLEDDLCGPDVQIVAQTQSDPNADLIKSFEVEVLPANSSSSIVNVSWSAPEKPNGHILNYVVTEIRNDEPNSKTDMTCISLFNRENLTSQIISGLQPGNYTFQISATTLAGQGNFSAERIVIIKAISHLGIIASPSFLGLLFLIAASCIAVFLYKVWKQSQPPDNLNQSLENFESDDFTSHH